MNDSSTSPSHPRTTSPGPAFKFADPTGDIAAKFDNYIKIVVGIFAVTTLTLVVMVGGMLLDAWHFNSATYREYSQKTEFFNTGITQTTQNQELILQQQQQIIDLQRTITQVLKK